MKNKRKFFWTLILIISIIVCIVSSTFIAMYFFNSSDQSEYKKEVSTTNNETTLPTKDVIENPVNWKKLRKKNADVYAWIIIPNTKVDYAVTQAGKDKSDEYYLNHNLEGNYEFAGTIYSEKQNSLDFSDPVTLLYGHNMLNGTMFATLHDFEDSDFFKKNKYMYIYTPGRKLTYLIYAAYVYDDRHILNSFDFSDETVLLDYFKTTKNPVSMTKNIRKKVKLNKNSKILTLSTCTRGASNTRYLVQGVLIKNEQTE